MKPEYWTFFTGDQLCSKHSSFQAAERAVRKCEREGGADHSIYQVTPCAREFYLPKKAKRPGK